MKSSAIRKTVFAAVLAALIAAATMVITLPLPPTGYVHLGDGLVLLAGWLLGPVWGGIAAGLGSALADLVLGYALYVPGTFVVKALTAALAALMVRVLSKTVKNHTLLLGIGAVVGECVMVFGYFLYEAVFLGTGFAAAASIPSNLMQGAVGLVLFLLLSALFRKYRMDEQYFH